MASSVTSAVASPVTSAVGEDWLTIDTSAAQVGYGPAQTPGPDQDSVPVVPTPDNPLPGQPIRVPAAEGFQYAPEGEGPWPYVPEGYNAWQAPLQRPMGGVPQGGEESLLPALDGPGMWNDYDGAYPGYDHLSQRTDNAGWFQNVPTGRSASRNTFGQSNPLNNPTWMPFGERPVTAHLAITAVDVTSDEGTFGIAGIADGGLPDWSMTGGQGNTAYETPGPPPVSEPVSTGSLIDDSGWA